MCLKEILIGTTLTLASLGSVAGIAGGAYYDLGKESLVQKNRSARESYSVITLASVSTLIAFGQSQRRDYCDAFNIPKKLYAD